MPRPLPPELGPVFGVKAARALGVSQKRLAGSDLHSEFRGSRSIASAEEPVPDDFFEARYADLLRRCRAYVPVAPAGFRFSHITAARLYGIPLPLEFGRRTELDVTVSDSYPPRMKGIIGHRTTHQHSSVVRELPVLPAEQVWLQLASVLDLDDLIVAGDHLVRRKRPISSLAKLHAAVGEASGVPGIKRARDALLEIRPGTDSPMESRMRLTIVRAGLPEPAIRHTVYFEGYFVGTPDLAYVRERVALDFDGKLHLTDERVYLDDVERRALFEDADWRYLTITKNHFRVPRSFLARLERLLTERG
jgi:hypothetical protein